jgi:uncharacterized protein (DUF885 family)
MKRILMGLALSFVASGAMAAEPAPPATLASISESFFKQAFKASPSWATAMGIHDYDAQLERVDDAAHAATVARLEAALGKLDALDPAPMTLIERDDREVFIAWLKGQLLEENVIQMWQRNPDTYVGLGLSAVNSLVTRDFAPLETRLALVIARERQFPRMLKEAKANLRDMPPVYIDVALEDLGGAKSFLKDNVPDAFATVADPKLKAELAASTRQSVAALADFEAFLTAHKAGASGHFKLGRDAFISLLQVDLITTSPEELLALGEAQLSRDRAAFDETSKQIDPEHPEKALDDIGSDHPSAKGLIPTARDQLAGLRKFIEDHHIITLPFPLMPKVQETPAFQRAVVFGELDWPGPFETKATESYYYITPPDEKDTPEAQEKFLTLWSRALLQNLSVHEALPGHFVQGLYLKAHPEWSIIRKAISSYTATEGWAHYTEQMMLDEGLSAGDPKAKLAQLSDALLRDCRLVDSIKLHVEGITLDEATQIMRDRCAIPDTEAFKEARRGTLDPGYLSYTFGKLEILALREDVKRKEGADFSLQRFHDRFQSAGLVPVPIIRREILRD